VAETEPDTEGEEDDDPDGEAETLMDPEGDCEGDGDGDGAEDWETDTDGTTLLLMEGVAEEEREGRVMLRGPLALGDMVIDALGVAVRVLLKS